MTNEENLFVQTDKLKKQAETIADIFENRNAFDDVWGHNTPQNFLDTLIHWKRGYLEGRKYSGSFNDNIFCEIYLQLSNVSTDGIFTKAEPIIHKVEIFAYPEPLDYIDYEEIQREIDYALKLGPGLSQNDEEEGE